jgi:glycerophosphoryl diester phosphodiesterase
MAKPLDLPGKNKPYIMAHRGNRVSCPENTLASFKCAFEEKADILETDLHQTADGVFVCIHDATLERTTNGQGLVAEHTLAQLKKLSASYGRPEYAQEQIPTLAEMANILPLDVAIGLELKSDAFTNPMVAYQLLTELADLGIRERTVILSFARPRLAAIRQIDPQIPLGWITLKCPLPPTGMELAGPFWPLLLINPFYTFFAHRRGQLVCPLDPTPDKRLRLYKWLGCDTVLTDNPGATRQALEALR